MFFKPVRSTEIESSIAKAAHIRGVETITLDLLASVFSYKETPEDTVISPVSVTHEEPLSVRSFNYFDALTHNSLQLTGDSVQNCCCHQ